MSDTQRMKTRQVDRALDPARGIPAHPPSGGWIRAIREALGMSLSHLAARLHVTPQSVHALELRERVGSATLRAMREAAEALDADFVYAIVPRRPIAEMVRAQAEAVAARAVDRVAHSMALENQAVASREHRRQVRELADELVREHRRSLWNAPE